jgi:hypothetical protein
MNALEEVLGEELYSRFLKALDVGGNTHEPEDILAALRTDKFRMWLAPHVGQPTSMAITELVIFPRKKAIRIVLTAGKLDADFFKVEREIEEYGVAERCDFMIAAGRNGWHRAATKLGFNPAWQGTKLLRERA